MNARAALLLLPALACARSESGPLASANTAPTSQTHAWFSIASGPHAVSCNVCHGEYNSFRQFDCLSCHAHDQAPTARLHASVERDFSYASAACYSCHRDADGGRHSFSHTGIVSGCAQCHVAGASFAALPVDGFTHPNMSGGDCAACHLTSSWKGVGGPSGVTSDPAASVTVDGAIPSYSGTWITSVTSRPQTLVMEMLHASAQVPAVIAADCVACHSGASSASYRPGRFHSSLDGLGLAQPQACLDCHAGAAPAGFVGPLASAPPRTPPTGEMRHDAVEWSGDQPTSLPMVTLDCAVCHAAGSWAAGRGASGRPSYHAALASPSSCLDCHANTRPAGVLSSANAALPAGVQFDHSAGAAAGDCVSCHAGAGSWTGGKFHAAESATPSSCLPCHAGERPTSISGWRGDYSSRPFDYGGNSLGNTHGDGLDCVSCHTGPGTGAWGGTQNWAGGSFAHGSGTVSASTCIACHASQRPDLNGVSPSQLAGSFDHSNSAGLDCFSCHQATVSRATYVNYRPIPGGDWSGGVGFPAGLSSDPAQNVSVTAGIPAYSGTSIVSIAPRTDVLPMQMSHGSSQLTPMFAGDCLNCHASAAFGAYFPGAFHSSLSTLGVQQPLVCLDCHAGAAPAGFVGAPAANPPRSPPSGEMKHDAVAWSAGQPTSTALVTQDCALCHAVGSWKTGHGGAGSPAYHASLAVAPSSCLDCHANTRPAATLTSANAALPAGVSFDHASAASLGDCVSCHSGSSNWTGGRLHLKDSAAPSSCLPCHSGERPTSSTGWKNTTYTNSPFDYGGNARTTHGDGLDCVTCHANPGSGAWGVNEDWAAGLFAHGSGTASASTCIICHASQRPDLNGILPSQLAGSFGHSTSAGIDCFSCHQATVSRGTYLNYRPIPGGDWSGGVGFPAGLSSDPAQNVSVTAGIPAYSGTSIVTITARSETLLMQMNHGSSQLTPSFDGDCLNCHVSASAGVFFPGAFHSSLSTLGVLQPTTCFDCHAGAAPAGFVGATATNPARTPPSGEMKHDAVAWSAGQPTSTALVTQDCALCHAVGSWKTGHGGAGSPAYHASLAAAPSSCLDCHANTRPSGVLSSSNASLPAGVQFDHSAAVAMGDCVSCHSGSSSWTGGRLHLKDSVAPSSCLPCHSGERPTSSAGWKNITYTKSPFDYGGNTRTTHGDGLDCAACHANPGSGAWGVNQDWAGGSFAHGMASADATTCIACHASQRPDLNGILPSQLAGAFDHSKNAGTDCIVCHQATVTRRSYVNYLPIPGGDWSGGVGSPAGATFDPAQDVLVTGGIPSYSGTSIVSVTPRSETLPMQMVHGSSQVPAAIGATCVNCHRDAGSGAYYPGTFHASLTALAAAQPVACLDCHAGAAPVGFVGPTATNPARTPASAEMKHDAVAWAGGKPGSTALVTQDCAQCHLAPLQAAPRAWGVGRSGAAPALYHASLAAAPSSCVDCHANTRSTGVLTSAVAALPSGVQFDHTASVALGDCVSCHTSSSSWTGGKLHLIGSSSPSSCVSCHEGERPASTANWKSTSYSSSPFDYGGNTLGNTHGDGLDCASCHSGPGTGAWGGTQNWVGGSFAHGPATPAASTCVACHFSQRPDLNGVTPSQLPGSFDHAASGTGDCIGCHQATVARGIYLAYLPIPNGDWRGGVAYPGDTLIGASDQNIKVTEIQLNRGGTANLVIGTSATTATLYDQMLHTTANGTPPGGMPSQVYPGPLASPDATKCWHCHTNSNGTVTSFLEGQFHSALNNYSATPGGMVTPLSQPTSCLDCHGQMRPAAIVEKSGSDLQPMDHSAAFTSGATVAQMECATCHTQPGSTWTDGVFHSNIGATPADCAVCHYPLMADATKADVTRGTDFAMKHASSQLTIQACDTCHAAALSMAKTTPIASSLWQGGALHPSVTAQPALCADCHSGSLPASDTQSVVTYRFAAGGTSSNAAQWMNHDVNGVVGNDCAVCHLADAKASGAAWSKLTSFHAAMPGVTACSVCHGLGNGVGSTTAGTNNNMPSGLTDSTTLTTASNDPTTGVPAGTHDQINHADINVTGRDCNACHTQAGASSTPGIQGLEWAQASFHANFSAVSPLIMNGTAGRCSNCHMNVKPGAGFTGEDHSSFTDVPGTPDCAGCHTWPGTGSAASPNWLGAAGAPAVVTLTGWSSGTSITSNTVTFAHPSPSSYTSCAQCHTGSTNSTIIDYNHDGLQSNVTINGVAVSPAPNLGTSQYNISTNPTFCVACHNTGSAWISKTGLSSTITANTTSGGTTVTTASTSALTAGMIVSGTGIPNSTTTTTTFTANTTSGSTTVTTASPVSLSAGTVISGPGIPANDRVATSVTNATSFTLQTAATATATGVTLTATTTTPLTVTIKSITSTTAVVISSAANATVTGTTLNVTHQRITQAAIGNHAGSTNGEDCTSCHYVGGNQHLTPPTPGVFGTGSINGG